MWREMLSSNAKYQGSCLTHPYVAPHTSKIHTLITLGIRHRNNPLVSKAWQRLPRGFDSHRPLHFRMCHRAVAALVGRGVLRLKQRRGAHFIRDEFGGVVTRGDTVRSDEG